MLLLFYTMQNKERAEFLGRIAFYCFLGSNTCTAIIEVRACVSVSSAVLSRVSAPDSCSKPCS
jgi:hypothetical protein